MRTDRVPSLLSQKRIISSTDTMSRIRISPLLGLLFCLILSVPCTPLLGQDVEEDLYFPPKLNIGVVTGERGMSYLSGTEGMPAVTGSHELIMRWRIRSKRIDFLPMVFFDQGSSAIPDRYQLFTGSSDAQKYKEWNETLKKFGASDDISPKYYEVLNILGSRMTLLPASTITLEGGYSPEPGEDAEIAYERSEVVREYLINIWRIAPERISLLPARRMADSADHMMKQEEGRRVIIGTNDWRLLRPVRYQELSYGKESMFILFTISLEPQMRPEEIANITLLIASEEELLSRTELPVSIDSSTYHYIGLWLLPRQPASLRSRMTVEAIVETYGGKTRKSNTVYIPVIGDGKKRDDDEEFARYSEMIDPNGVSDGSVLFFESGDTSLGKLQYQMLEKMLEGFRNTISMGPEEKWSIVVQAEGEASDNPAIDPITLGIKSVPFISEKEYVASLLDDPSFQVPLYILPRTSTTDADETGSLQYMEAVVQTWLGDRMDDLKTVSEQEDISSPSDKGQLALGKFLSKRASSVMSLIQDSIGTPDIEIHDETGIAPWYKFFFLPEARFYKRSVSISLNSSSIEKGREGILERLDLEDFEGERLEAAREVPSQVVEEIEEVESE